MLHYDALCALAAVAKERSFARAARLLHLTQPAVSQRVRLLEDQLGEHLLCRDPIKLTPAGTRLVQHLQEVQRMEREIGRAADEGAADGQPIALTIGVNADSLATWLLDALTPLVADPMLRIELLVEDEDYTFELLRKGQVLGAISSVHRPLHGCEVRALGTIDYVCVSSPEFRDAHWRPVRGVSQLCSLPCMAFGRRDNLQENFLERELKLKNVRLNPHLVASNSGYLEAVLKGWGWGLVPAPQATELLKQRRLVKLTPGKGISVTLYWHQWRGRSELGKRLEKLLFEGAEKVLRLGSSISDPS